jgi:Holin of 3TMs, for gene-transfer release
MGLMGYVVGAGRAAGRIGGAAEVFVGNAAERDRSDLERVQATLEQYKGEYEQAPAGPFDSFVDALNRLPRPMLALGTLALIVYAMADPAGFSERMVGLNLVPAPLWWLLGAIVSFYFGARELHHYRSYRQGSVTRASVTNLDLAQPVEQGPEAGTLAEPAPFLSALSGPFTYGRTGSEPAIEVRAADPEFNAALEEWRQRQPGC